MFAPEQERNFFVVTRRIDVKLIVPVSFSTAKPFIQS